MRRIILAGLLVPAIVGAFGSAPAGAAPINKHTVSVPASCEGIGTVEVSFNGQSQSATGFLPDGQVVVVKRGFDSFSGTFAIEGGPTLTVTAVTVFEFGGPGRGYEGRLVTCTAGPFPVEESFVLDQEGAAFLLQITGVDVSAFIGATVHLSGTDTFTGEVLIPGRS
jgi:hypothetical protein